MLRIKVQQVNAIKQEERWDSERRNKTREKNLGEKKEKVMCKKIERKEKNIWKKRRE